MHDEESEGGSESDGDGDESESDDVQQSGMHSTRVWATDMTRARRAGMDMVHFCLRPVSASDCRICFGFMHLIDRM